MKCIDRATSIVLCVVVLAACSPAPAPAPSTDNQQPSPALEERYRPVERAKAVEDQVLEQKRKQDAQIEQQGG